MLKQLALRSLVGASCRAALLFLCLGGCQGISRQGSSSLDEAARGDGKDAQGSDGAVFAPETMGEAGDLTLDDAGAVVGEDAALPVPDGAVTPPIAGSAGCGNAAAPAEGMQTLQVNGKGRTFIVHVPDNYDARTAYPLLFGFHGASRSAADFDNDKGTFRFGPALGERAILVYPNALPKNNVTTWSRDTDDDLAFFDAMLAKLSTDLCLNPERIFATGHSSGGYFANTLGCRRGDVLRAIAPVAGGIRDFKDCRGEVAVWMAHGTKDTQVKLSLGQAARDHFVGVNACAKEPPPSAVEPSPCQAYAGCRAGYPVHWCEHDQPTYGAPPTYHGWPSFATAAIVTFLEALP